MVRWYEPKHAYIVMKLDCMLQRADAHNSVDLTEMHDFVKVFRTLPTKHQMRYAHLLDEMAEYYDEEEQPCN